MYDDLCRFFKGEKVFDVYFAACVQKQTKQSLSGVGSLWDLSEYSDCEDFMESSTRLIRIGRDHSVDNDTDKNNSLKQCLFVNF